MDPSLLCDEEWLSNSTHPTSYRTPMERSLADDGAVESFCTSSQERNQAFLVCLDKEISYLPVDGYLEHIQSSDLVHARSTAVEWILKACYRFNISIGVVFDAVNFLDRYISVNRCWEWKDWMFELLSIACFSIACKCNKASAPSFLEFQDAEDLDHSFGARTIQGMELAVLTALGWRVNCVTAYSYVDLMTWHTHCHQPQVHVALTARMTELLLGTLSESKFIKFRPCTVAVSALRCGLEELLPSKSDDHLADLFHLLPHDQMGCIEKCHKTMEDYIADSTGGFYCHSSPVSVIPMEGVHTSICSIDFSAFETANPKKRKRVELVGSKKDDHRLISQFLVHKR